MWANDFGYATNSNSATILGYTGSNSTMTIPSTIGGLPVTSIGDNAFADQPWITSLLIPSGVTNLGANAFSGCSNLTSVSIPDSVVTFGTNLFGSSPNVVVKGSQDLISYLAQNAVSLGFSGNALTSIQNGGTASGSFDWIKGWLLADSSFLNALSSVLQVPSTIANNLSNAIVGLATQTSPTNPVFVSAVAAQILAASNNYGMATKQDQSLNFPAIPAQTLPPGKPLTLNVSSSANQSPILYTSANSAVARISNNILTILGAGSTTITASQAGNNLYNPVSVSQPLVVTKGTQSINFPAIAPQTYTAFKSVTLRSSSSGGLANSYLIGNGAIGSISNNILLLLGTGTTTITATNSGNSYYAPAGAVQTLIVK